MTSCVKSHSESVRTSKVFDDIYLWNPFSFEDNLTRTRYKWCLISQKPDNHSIVREKLTVSRPYCIVRIARGSGVQLLSVGMLYTV